MLKITVIIPVFNAMPYLPEALASLASQTFRDFDVILWDNGSTDASLAEAKRWIPARLSGKVISGRALPLHMCLAAMVEEAKTDFIARMDGDDVCLPERFEEQMEEIAAHPDLAALGTQRIEIDSNGKTLPDPPRMPSEFPDVLSKFLVGNALIHPTVIFRREAILAAGNYTPCEKPCEDFDLWLRVAKRNEIRNSNTPLLEYRVHDSGIISSARRAETLEKPNTECIRRHASELFGIAPEYYAKLRYKKTRFSFPFLMRAAKHIAVRANVPTARVLNSEYFLWSARSLTAHKDIPSRALWGLFDRLPNRRQCQIRYFLLSFQKLLIAKLEKR